jgi:hypothetical protein
MQRFYQFNENVFTDSTELNQRTAFHEAGHAAAIYLGNKLKNLPSIYFQIQKIKLDGIACPVSTQVTGGRLIDDLSMIRLEDTANIIDSSVADIYQMAYEADIINFLAGPLAEAKYVSIRDDEVFNFNLLTPCALNNYGGSTDMKHVRAYLEFFISSPMQQEAKLNDLFTQAYRFVIQPSNWKSISALARYILDSAEEKINCERIMEVLDRHQLESHCL